MKNTFRPLLAVILVIAMILPCFPLISSAASYTTGTYKPSETDGLNIRSGASTSYAKVGGITYGTSFVVTEISGSWGKTTSGGVTGWVCLDYATKVSTNTSTVSGYVNTRNDGTWLFPVDQKYYNLFSDWCCCPGRDTCTLCNKNHGDWGDDAHTGHKGHNGIDIATPTGTPVYAAASGTYYTGGSASNSRGYYVVIEHPLGDGSSYYSGYQHLSKFNTSLKSGQTVQAGDIIGYSGSSGMSGGEGYGSHMHFGIVIGKSGKGLSGLETYELWGTSNPSNPWVTSPSQTEGRIVTNPADNFPTSAQCTLEAIKVHKGSVHYTFDKTKVSIGAYNAAAAIEYGKNHWNDGNGLCAEFVSNCLKAGGSSSWSWGCTNLVKMLQDEGLGTLHKLNVNSNGTVSLDKNKDILSPGDPIFVYSSGCLTVDGAPYVHTYLYYGTDSNGNLKGYAHNNALNGTMYVYFTCAYCGKMTDGAYVYHMNSTGSSQTTPTYYLDVNGYVDGEYKTSLNGFVTFDVYVGGSLVKSGVGDFCTAYADGTKYEIKNIKAASGYTYVSGSNLSGTISGGHAYPTITLTTTIKEPSDTSNLPDGWLKSIPSGENSKNYASAVFYRYRDTTYGSWSASQTTTTAPTASDVLQIVSTTKYYNYYHYCCQYYSGGYNVDSIKYGTGGVYHTLKTTTKLTTTNVHDKGGKTLYGGESKWACSKNFHVWAQADPFETYEYSYQTRTKTISSWSSWSQTKPSSASGREIESITLYKYQPVTYTVDYNANGGSNAPASQTKTDSKTLTLSSTTPTRSGYTFKGWATSASGSVAYQPGSSYTANAAVTLYAVWQKNPEKYTIKFDAAGGSGAPANQTKTENVALTLSSTTPTRSGYTFKGWATSASGSVAYQPGATFTTNANTTLYAVWQKNVSYYTVKFNANGGSGAPANQTKTENVALTLSSTVPTRSGYTFKGWATSASGSVAYQPGATFTTNANTTLYAVWQKNPEKYTIKFDAAGGSGAPANQTKTENVALTLSSTTPTRSGYTFKGWSTSANGSVAYQPGATFTTNANTTLYAVWQKNPEKYTIKFDAAGGSGAPANQTKTENVALTLSSTTPTRSGYTFKGWATSASGSVAYQPGATFTTNANTTLYAVWQKNPEKYTIKFDAAGGSGAPANQTKTENVALTLSNTIPTRSGYTFKGWSTSASGSVAYQPGASFTTNANTTLYAVWQKNVSYYTVKFNANGGSGAPANQTKTENVALTLSSTVPTRSGYTFKGWATSASGSVAYQPGSSYTANAAVTLYAVWQKNVSYYTVKFNANGGSGAPANQTKTENVALTLSNTVPTRSGYTFKGWATAEYGPVAYQPGASYTENKSITLYAVWQQNAPISGGSIVIDSKTCTPGSTVKVNVSIKDNPGLCTLAFKVKYDSNALELVSVENGEVFDTVTHGTARIIIDTRDYKNVYTNGVLCTLTFKVKDTASSGSYEISLGSVEALDYDINDHALAISSGNITVVRKYTVKFDAAGGSGAPANQTKTENVALTLSSTTPTRSGYTFKGWATSASGSVAYQPGATFTTNANTTLYAVWQKNPEKYVITYNANGGSGAPANQTKTENVALTLSSTTPTRSGYTFKGWATSASGSVAYQPGATFTTNANTTLYAVWQKNPEKYTIKFDAAGGSGAPANQTKTENVALTLSSTTPTRSGYTFKGWATSASGSVAYQPGASFTTNANTTLYAVWQKSTMPSAGRIVIDNKTCTAGSTVKIDVKVEGNTGFAFLSITAKYDKNVLELVNVENGTLISDMTASINIVFLSDDNVKSNGVLLSLTFKVKENANSGDYDIGLSVNELYDQDANDKSFTVSGGKLTVMSFVYGDANGDGKVDGKDIVLLKKYIANYDYDTGKSSVSVCAGADANGDGKVDGKDIVLLKKYIANYDYDTGKSSVVLGPTK